MNKTFTLAAAASCALLLVGCNALPFQHEPDARAAADEAVVAAIRQKNPSNFAEGILFWGRDERAAGFRNIDRIYSTRRIRAGVSTRPLEPWPVDLSGIRYEVDGESFSFGEFVQRPEHVGLLVVQDGRVLYEAYANGNDASSRWISFSVTKSITSMLIGAAIQDGYIESVDEPLVRYLPRLRGSGYEGVTIANLLQMASGVRWNEDYEDPDSDVARAGGSNGMSLARYMAELPREHEPGEAFNYNTGETNLVGQLLRSAIGNNASTYLEAKIWQPFGMEHDANWVISPDSLAELGGCCLSMTLRDYARVGMFALAEGQLDDGSRVLPAGWMDASTAASSSQDGYGYSWWLADDHSYAANGIFGQIIQVDPSSNSVIAIHSNTPTAVGSKHRAHIRAASTALRTWLRAQQGKAQPAASGRIDS